MFPKPVAKRNYFTKSWLIRLNTMTKEKKIKLKARLSYKEGSQPK